MEAGQFRLTEEGTCPSEPGPSSSDEVKRLQYRHFEDAKQQQDVVVSDSWYESTSIASGAPLRQAIGSRCRAHFYALSYQ